MECFTTGFEGYATARKVPENFETNAVSMWITIALPGGGVPDSLEHALRAMQGLTPLSTEVQTHKPESRLATEFCSAAAPPHREADMAKVTLTIEDKVDEEGNPGLIIECVSSNEDDDKSIANFWGLEALNFVANQGDSRVMDEEEASVYKKQQNEGMN